MKEKYYGKKKDTKILAEVEKPVDPLDVFAKETYDFMKMFDNKESSPDTLIFTLKSAVPAARIVKKLWKDFYPDRNLPQIKYVNIGIKDYSVNLGGSSYDDRMNETIDVIVDIPEDDDLKYKFQNIKPDEKILIIDEYSDSGTTLKTAVSKFNQLFPHAKIKGTAMFKTEPFWVRNEFKNGIQDLSPNSVEQQAFRVIQRDYAKKGIIFKDEFDIVGLKEKEEINAAISQKAGQIENSASFNVVSSLQNEDPKRRSRNRDVYNKQRESELKIIQKVITLREKELE